LTAIIESLGSVAEGVQTIERVLELASRYHLSMPITEQMQLIISGKTTPSEALQNLLRRPSRAEFGG
jgi:glycerol-3-phosphate dehydrogenase (NAD(P)+)